MYSRTFSLEDIQIRSGPHEDGRTVEAYAAIFDVPAPIQDQDGTYEEVIDRSAFNKAVNDARPTGSRKSWRCGVFYNHGKTLYGTASERHSEPIGTCLDIVPDSKGLLTVTRYNESARNILESIREGSLNSYSFSGAFKRSDPSGNQRHRPDANGNLRTVRRLESTLREYGPTPFPAYEDAAIVGMRAEQMVAHLSEMPDEERARIAELLIASIKARAEEPTTESVDTSTPEAVTGEPLPHSTQYHKNALYRIRSAELLKAKGITLPRDEKGSAE